MDAEDGTGIQNHRSPLGSLLNSSLALRIDLSGSGLTAEQLLQYERDFAESIIQTAQVVVLVLDTEGRVIHINPYMEELSGYRLDDVQGRDWFDTFLTPADHGKIRELFKKAIANIQTRGNVNPILTRGGRLRYIEWYDRTLKKADGRVIGLLAIGVDVTDKLKAEESLRRSEAQFRTLFEAVAVGVVVVARDGHITHANQVAGELLGFRSGQLLKQTTENYVDCLLRDDGSPLPYAQFPSQVTFRTGRPQRNVILGIKIRSSGRLHWLVVNTELVSSGDSDITDRVMVTLNDITSLNNAQHALQRAHDELEHRVRERTEQLQIATERLQAKTRQLEAITDHLPDIVFRFDRQLRKVYVNPAIEKYTHIPRDRFIGTDTSFPGFPSGQVAYLNERLEEVFQTGRMVVFDFALTTDAGIRYFEERAIPERSESNETTHIVAIVRDVTDRKLAEQGLRESEHRFRLMAESIREVVWLMDWPEGRLMYVSPAYEAIWGKAMPESSGQLAGWLEPVHESDRIRMTEKIGTMYRDGINEIFRIYHTNGSVRWLHMKGVPITDETKTVRRLTGTIEDITEVRRAEEEHRRRQAEYAHIFRLATAGEMADGLAHELNQPFCAIVNLAEAALMGLKTGRFNIPGQIEHLSSIGEQAQRAGRIIRRLRELVQKRKPHITNIRLNDLVHETLHLVRHDLDEAEVSVVTDLDHALPQLQADWIQIQQVLINLIRNAIDALMTSAVTRRRIAVHTRYADGDDEVEVSVTDNGPGLTPELREQVFEPYYTSRQEGMGLGLSICRSIMESHRGRIWLDESVHGGATFRFTLPVRKLTPPGGRG